MIRQLPACGLALLAATPAFAHTGAGAHESLVHGFVHPVSGLDHVLAMVAVGLWAALIGGRALWAWPLAFVSVMALGALAGLAGVPVAGIEAWTALSVAILGLAVCVRAPLPVVLGAGLCGFFAFVHGVAHGVELPPGADAAGYIAGFALATALLHGLGLAAGFALARIDRIWTPGLAGAVVALTGVGLLFG